MERLSFEDELVHWAATPHGPIKISCHAFGGIVTENEQVTSVELLTRIKALSARSPSILEDPDFKKAVRQQIVELKNADLVDLKELVGSKFKKRKDFALLWNWMTS